MIRKIAIIGFKIFVLVNIVFGLVGISSIFLTISFYFLIWYVATGVCVFFVRNAEKRINYRLFITVFVIALFGCELVLKYGTKSHLSYSEKNGNFFYNSMYRKGYLENYKRKYNQKQSDIQIFTRKPYGNVILSKPEFMYEHSYNSLGLRDKEPKCDTGIYTIIGLGDSFTEGVGSPQDSTWLRLLEANISGREKTRSFQTINAGVSDSDPFAEYLLLERKLMIYKPDLVIVAVNTTDVDDIIVRGGMERFVDGSIEYNSGPWWEFFYQFSYIVRVVVHRVLHYNFMLLSDQQYEMRKKIAMQKMKDCIDENYKKLAKVNDFRLVFVLHPLQYELDQKKFVLQPLWDQIKNDTSFTTINLFDEFRKRNSGGNDVIFWQKDGHNNSKGYKLWADIIAEILFPNNKQITQ